MLQWNVGNDECDGGFVVLDMSTWTKIFAALFHSLAYLHDSLCPRCENSECV